MVAHIEVGDAPRRVFEQRQQGGDAAFLTRKQVGIDGSRLSSLQAPDKQSTSGVRRGKRAVFMHAHTVFHSGPCVGTAHKSRHATPELC